MMHLPSPAPRSVDPIAAPSTGSALKTPLRSAQMRTAWATLALCGLLTACGGGGGGDAGPAATPPPPVLPPARAAVTLTAEEDLAWKSYVLRTVGVRAVDETDDSLLTTPYFGSGRFDFAGLYPTGTGTGTSTTGQSNIPGAAGTVGLCKDGGSSVITRVDVNNNGFTDQGDSFTVTETDCKDGNTTLNGTFSFDYLTQTKNYPKPNDSAIESRKGLVKQDELLSKVGTNFTLGQSVNGQIDVDISKTTRVQRYKDYKYVVDGVTVISNLVLTINRSATLGADKPFSLASMTGSLTIDGTTYQVSSERNIPWKKILSYLPTEGVFAMTAPNGEVIATAFTPNGASCGIFPNINSTTASLVVTNCSRR